MITDELRLKIDNAVFYGEVSRTQAEIFYAIAQAMDKLESKIDRVKNGI